MAAVGRANRLLVFGRPGEQRRTLLVNSNFNLPPSQIASYHRGYDGRIGSRSERPKFDGPRNRVSVLER